MHDGRDACGVTCSMKWTMKTSDTTDNAMN